jgi:hypothetical protein
MRRITIVFLLCLFSAFCRAQSADETTVKEVIVQVFKAMEKGDSALLHSAFSENITMATIFRDKTNVPVIHHEMSLDGFLKAVGTPHKEVWYEEFWNLEINVDGDFAQAWCDYAFYLDDKFSHCGVDAIHLHKTKSGWKIFHLADTRRKENCQIPKEILKKHGK